MNNSLYSKMTVTLKIHHWRKKLHLFGSRESRQAEAAWKAGPVWELPMSHTVAGEELSHQLMRALRWVDSDGTVNWAWLRTCGLPKLKLMCFVHYTMKTAIWHYYSVVIYIFWNACIHSLFIIAYHRVVGGLSPSLTLAESRGTPWTSQPVHHRADI